MFSSKGDLPVDSAKDDPAPNEVGSSGIEADRTVAAITATGKLNWSYLSVNSSLNNYQVNFDMFR